MASHVRYSFVPSKWMVTSPDLPSGTIHPCCQPFTVIGVSCVVSPPSSSVAMRPGFACEGLNSTRFLSEASRRVDCSPGASCSRGLACSTGCAAGVSRTAAPYSGSATESAAQRAVVDSTCLPAGRFRVSPQV